MTKMIDCYEPVAWFQAQMLRRLSRDDNQEKRHWNTATLEHLLDLLRIEVIELDNIICVSDYSGIVNEAADVANFAMMIADKARIEGIK